MRDHVKIVAILNIALGCLGILAGVVVLVIFGGLAGVASVSSLSRDQAAAVPILGIIGVGLAVFLFVLSVPGVIGGFGLLKFRPWARILMIVISALNLLHFPLGTALGVYGLWTLLNEQTRRLFEASPGGFVPPIPPTPATYRQPPPPGV
jgi:hypothetical protein